MKSKLITRKLAIGIVSLAVLGSAAGWYALSDSGPAAALTELNPTSFAQLKKEFNAAVGDVRVIVLLSPT